MPWATAGTPNTLVAIGDLLDIDDLGSLDYYQFLAHTICNANSVIPRFTLRDDGTASYSQRSSGNGTAEGTDINANDSTVLVQTLDALNEQGFIVNYCYADNDDEKINICFSVDNDNGLGSGVAPNRRMKVWKYVNAAVSVDSVECNNIGTGSYLEDTNLSALGTD